MCMCMCLWDLCLVSVVLEVSIWLRRLTGSRLFFVVVLLVLISTSCSVCISRDRGTVSKERKRWRVGGDSVLRKCPLRYVMFKGLFLSLTLFLSLAFTFSFSLSLTRIRNGAPSQTAYFESSESLQSQNIPVSDLIYGVTVCACHQKMTAMWGFTASTYCCLKMVSECHRWSRSPLPCIMSVYLLVSGLCECGFL